MRSQFASVRMDTQLEKQGNMSGEHFSNDQYEKGLGDSLITDLEAEQKHCLKSIAGKHDMCGILPTGFDKNLIFQLPRVEVEQNHCLSSGTPLASIMKDQVEEMKQLEIKVLKAFAIFWERRGSRKIIERLTRYDVEIYMEVQDIIGSDTPSKTPNPCFLTAF